MTIINTQRTDTECLVSSPITTRSPFQNTNHHIFSVGQTFACMSLFWFTSSNISIRLAHRVAFTSRHSKVTTLAIVDHMYPNVNMRGSDWALLYLWNIMSMSIMCFGGLQEGTEWVTKTEREKMIERRRSRKRKKVWGLLACCCFCSPAA